MDLVEDIDSRPTVCDEVLPTVISEGTHENQNFRKVYPIEGSDQYGGRGQYIGHFAYSPDMDEIIYQNEKAVDHFLYRIEGGGIALSKSVIDVAKSEYEATKVLVGERETQNVLVIPVSAFDTPVDNDAEQFDQQVRANKRRDVIRELPDMMSQLFSKQPSESERTIERAVALGKITDSQ